MFSFERNFGVIFRQKVPTTLIELENFSGAVSILEEDSIPVVQTITVPDDDSAFEKEYSELRSKLGISASREPSYSIKRNLAIAIQEECAGVYELSKVTEFMDKKTLESRINEKNNGLAWAWTPLRLQDVDPSWRKFQGEAAGKSKIQLKWRGQYPFNLWDFYERAIPFPVLATIDRIQQRIPEAMFLISDIVSATDPDPFLAVTMPRCPLYVIERWDEPGFRG